MQKIIYLILLLSLNALANLDDYKITPAVESKNIHIKILDAKVMQSSNIHELSGLAYSDGRLYALSDKGILYLFSLTLEHDKIEKLLLREQYQLRNKKSKRFKHKKRDSEGLAFYKDGFLISFERKNRVLYCSRKGKKIKKMQLNALLENNKNYESPNKGLESVAYSKKYGLITIPELPLKSADKKYHTLYAKNKIWKFQAEGAVTDIEFIDKNHLLVLLREFDYLTRRRMTSLLDLDLQKCDEKRVCRSKLLVKMDSNDGWDIDNFEGLTKVGKNRYLMVSDDNDNIFQKTLFVLFEIKS